MRSQNNIMINTLFFWLKNTHLKLGGLCIGCIQVLIYHKESALVNVHSYRDFTEKKTKKLANFFFILKG